MKDNIILFGKKSYESYDLLIESFDDCRDLSMSELELMEEFENELESFK